MSKLLDMLDDDSLDFTVEITDTTGKKAKYEFLDIVLYDNEEYAVLLPSDDDENVDIFKIISDGKNEKYEPVTDDLTLDAVFDIFRIKNEDEFEF